MKTLQEIQEQVAYESGYDPIILSDGTIHHSSWDECMNEIQGDPELINHYIDIVSTMYAVQALYLAAEKVEIGPKNTVDIDSILSLKDQLK